ncbi:aldehyde dehydrogenase family protein [Nocardia sp. NBC_00565]|uniref:aldehyde dehydrogenase family protein n=1 Tax=Nocardia sp. NBC_00565 TaxID=2975993 RepID=UPI002E821915|nr:aldehyde dehydrogenase family protein [Nocardia sp. NBC_00565]WUC05597.1 aldehyde dehydrogenase family protein [Nocardia sp. NBC_00565]
MSGPWNYDKMFIDGGWTADDAVGAIEVIDPATEEVIGSVPEAGLKAADAAIQAARRAFDDGPWPRKSPRERAVVLRRLAAILDERHDALRELIVAESGSVGFLADLIQVRGTIDIAKWVAEAMDHSVQWTEVSPPEGGPTGMAGHAVVREPVGVVAAITPFNFPFFLNIVKVLPALAAGCTVVLKPHQWTPLDAFEIAKAAADAELPPGVLNVIAGGADVGQELTTHPMVDMVTFTGSTPTGRSIMAAAAPTVKRLQLELGGKSASIVLDDVSEEHVAGMGILTSMIHAGQGCALHTRILLPEHLLDAYVEGAKKSLSWLKVGDPREPDTLIGPLIREQQRQRVEGYVQSGIDEGAELVFGGKRPEHLAKGFFYEPTLFVNARNDMRIAQEEIFGPVLTVLTYRTEEEAIRIANDSIFGLGGGVVAGNTARGFNVARQIRAGNVAVQTVGAAVGNFERLGGSGPGWSADQAKGVGITGVFGGFKQSGVGREWGHHGIEEFTELKTIAWS